jgi:hypothetical protein
MSKIMGKRSIYVDQRCLAVVNFTGDMVTDETVDQFRSDFNLLWTEDNLRLGENSLFANIVHEQVFVPTAHGAAAAHSIRPHLGSPWEMRVVSSETLTGVPLASPDSVELTSLQTTTPIHVRCDFLDENRDFIEEWPQPDNLAFTEAGSIAAYRTNFTYPKELLVQMSPDKKHNWGKDPGYIPEYLRFVHVVSPELLLEETQNYATKVGLDANWDKELEGLADYQVFATSISDFFSNTAGIKLEQSPMIDADKVFYDHTFHCDHMIADIENKIRFNGQARGFEYELKSSYNFYYGAYELLVNENDLEEIQLNDIYITLHQKNSQPLPTQHGKEKPENFTSVNSNLAIELMPSIVEVPGAAQATEIMRNIILSPKDIENMKLLNKFHYKFPMHAELRLNMGDAGPVAKILMESDLEEIVIRQILDSARSTTVPTDSGYGETDTLDGFVKVNFAAAREQLDDFPLEFNEELYSQNPISTSTVIDTTSVNTVDLDTFLGSLKELSVQSTDYGRYFVDKDKLDKLNEMDGAFQTDTNPYLQNLALMIAKSRIATLTKNKMRTYADMVAGKSAYSETIVYRVAKHRIQRDGKVDPVPQKNYYFFNDPNTNIFELIDTQVQYSLSYKYYVYAYKVVIGSRYSYTSPVFEDTQWDIVANPDGAGAIPNGVFKFKTNVLMSPSVVVCEVPVYGFRGIEQIESVACIYDEAPIYPNVDIVPYSNLGNKVLINISENVGRYIDEPIKILDDDEARHKEMIKAQKLRKGKKIIFESEDPAASYEIFRVDPDPETGLTEKPTSYEDLKGHLKYVIENDVTDSTNASFIEELSLNRKYYYVFRSVDIHDNISNPSPLYEVELVGDENKQNVFPNIRVVDFEEEIGRQPTKSFKRYLHISPTLDQISIDSTEYESAIGEMPLLGLKKERLFEADDQDLKKRPGKFKIRLTSKKTGRKIDVNVRFTHKHRVDVDVRRGHA